MFNSLICLFNFHLFVAICRIYLNYSGNCTYCTYICTEIKKATANSLRYGSNHIRSAPIICHVPSAKPSGAPISHPSIFLVCSLEAPDIYWYNFTFTSVYNINSMSCTIHICTRARLIYANLSLLEPGASKSRFSNQIFLWNLFHTLTT